MSDATASLSIAASDETQNAFSSVRGNLEKLNTSFSSFERNFRSAFAFAGVAVGVRALESWIQKGIAAHKAAGDMSADFVRLEKAITESEAASNDLAVL